MCGICSQHCPTYALTANENESPRGRLALIAAVNQGQLAINATLLTHLDHCLGCRACERSCPSRVPFGDIMDQARDLLEPQRPVAERRHKRLRHALFAHPRALRLALSGLRWIQKTGLSQAANAIPPIPATTSWQRYYPPQVSPHSPPRGDVALFLGCINQTLGQAALRASIRLLTAAGYGVHIPPRQTCCGALHKHNGDSGTAKKLARQNLHAFIGAECNAKGNTKGNTQKPPVSAILHTASGCTVMLKEYAMLFTASESSEKNQDAKTAHEFSAKVQDINTFIAAIKWPENVHFSPLQQRVTVHSPCSLKQVLRQADAPFQLLRNIPDIDLVALPDNGHCCGGAGSYMLDQPELANHLRKDKLSALDTSGAEILATSNIGCAQHLQTGLLASAKSSEQKESGKQTEKGTPQKTLPEVLHPVTLLARQLLIRQ